MARWSVPPLWTGKTVAVLASGPSMSLAVADQVGAASVPTIVTNDTYRLAPWADMLYAADAKWWQVNQEAWDFAGMKVTASEVSDCPGVLKLKQSGYHGFDPDPSCVRTGGNSGYQAVHVALHAGAKRVLLCGFDMKGSHWFGDHQRPLMNARPETLATRAQAFKQLAKYGDIVNCTPGSAIDCFRRMDLAAALSEA